MASEKSFAHLWLSEGFATYLTDLYFENKYGRDSMNFRLRNERKQVIDFARTSAKPVVDSISNLMTLLNANSYQKGAWVLHMLRNEVGDSTFQHIIRAYYERFKGSNAETSDLEKIAEEISKKDLGMFFNQWLFKPGLPELLVQWKYDAKAKKLNLTITQKQKQEVFQFPLQVRIQSVTGKSRIEKFEISNKTQSFSLDQKEKPANISIDPFTRLLFSGQTEKAK